ncbi:hypothetical protein MBLNU459_g7109t1 [Dothideomycetes sp. NU459]
MPAQRPRAAFEPIAPDFDINRLVEHTPNFLYVDRISCDQIDEQGAHAFEQLVLLHVIIGGKPLVVDGFENRLDPWSFTGRWLRDNVGAKVEQSRNLSSKDFLPLTIRHYLDHMGKLANQYFENPKNYKDKSRQRIYLKDIDCPQVWHDKLQEQLPASLFYLNESTGEPGGPGATVDPRSNIPGRRLGRGIARAGDLMSSLPPEMRAENLMCYIGHEGTYTPAHREMCATMGHNIMVEASGDVGEDGQPEKPGSSVWFMTESKDRNTVAEYWLSVLGHDIEVESHFAQLSAWKKAPFNVYVVEQKPGDFILIPPLAPHQVWNRGTRTMKVAWNRTTVETLEMAMNEALPKARIVCRDEQYKNKAIVYFTLMKYSRLLALAKNQADKLQQDARRSLLSSHKIKQLVKDFKRLMNLYKDVLLLEMFSPDGPQEKCEFVPFDSNVTCAYCRGNIFNRFLSCSSCKDALGLPDEEPYDVCMDCYAMGRSCGCISNLKWVEQFKWKELTQKYEDWRKQVIDLDGGIVNSRTPIPLLEARRNYPKRTLAEVCKDQLKRRPWVDIQKSKDEQKGDEESEEDIVVDDEGRVKKIVKKRSKTWLKTHSPCHICCKRHPNWKAAKCTTCEKWWCYGSLFRGYDTMPLDIMEDLEWSCPHCKGVCFAGHCRKDPKQAPYEPKGTLLGHDTRKVADARSVECLVDFSVSNLTWLRDDDDTQESARIRRAREEAEKAKEVDPRFDDHYVDGEENEAQVDESRVHFEFSPDHVDAQSDRHYRHQSDSLIDPALQEEPLSVRPTAGASTVLPPPAAMLQGARPDQDNSTLLDDGGAFSTVPEGYTPATTGGFIAPSAVMYTRRETEGGYAYPEPSRQSRAEDDENPKSGPFKRPYPQQGDGDEDKLIKMNPQSKKRRVQEDPSLATARPRNEATKQFEKEKERKTLEEAKKQGRFIAVLAALRGKSRIVKLPIPGARLSQFLTQHISRPVMENRPVLEVLPESLVQEETPQEDTVLLRSDIEPRKEKARKSVTKNPNKMRIRVEKDDDFSMRRDRYQSFEAKHKRNPINDFEEVDVASDDEVEGDSSGRALAPKGGANGSRRISSYIQRKHQDDPDLPDELPIDYKDSRRKNSQPRPGPKARAQMQSAVAMREGPATSAPATIPQVDGSDERVVDAVTPTTNTQNFGEGSPAAAKETSRNKPQRSHKSANDESAKRAEANRLAKLEALEMLDDESSDSASPKPAALVRAPIVNKQRTETPDTAPKTAMPRRSIFDSKGKNGKRIKILSAAAAAGKNGLSASKAKSSVKSVAAAAVAAASAAAGSNGDDSDSSDGQDVIPAKAPSSRRGLRV